MHSMHSIVCTDALHVFDRRKWVQLNLISKSINDPSAECKNRTHTRVCTHNSLLMALSLAAAESDNSFFLPFVHCQLNFACVQVFGFESWQRQCILSIIFRRQYGRIIYRFDRFDGHAWDSLRRVHFIWNSHIQNENQWGTEMNRRRSPPQKWPWIEETHFFLVLKSLGWCVLYVRRFLSIDKRSLRRWKWNISLT